MSDIQNNSTDKSGRRFFRFGLRTLFALVTLSAMWLGWQVHVVQHRKEVLAWMKERQWAVFESAPGTPSSLPWHRRLLGDTELSFVIPNGTPEEQQTVRAAFPEARMQPW